VIQLILSIARTARESGAGFTLVTPSAQLVDDFQTFGLFADMMTIAME
jgi:anti-anti-sigma regulatory factor